MEFYKPSLRLSFVYNHFTDKAYLKSTVTVYMPEHESLASLQSSYDPATKSGSQAYDHIGSLAEPEPYLYEHESMVEILGTVDAAYDPNNRAGFVAALRNELSPSYTFSVIVNEVPDVEGSGGRADGTIQSSNGEIGII